MNPSNKKVEYLQIAKNVHIFCMQTDQYKTSFEINLTSGGSYFEKENESGVSHLLEHCTVARTKELDFDQLQHFLFEKNIDRNASTSNLTLNFIMSGHRDETDKMLEMIYEFAFAPTFEQSILDQEKQIVLREIDQRSGDPDYRLRKFVMENVFEPGSLYLSDPLGKREDVINATLENLQTVYKRILSQSQVVIGAVGKDISIEKLKAELEKYLPNIESENALPIAYLPENKLKEFKFKALVNDLAHEHAILDIIIPFQMKYDDEHVRLFLNDLIFEYPVGVLYDKLRNKLGLVYGLYYDFYISGNMLDIQLICDVQNVNKIVEVIKDTLNNPEEVISVDKINIIRDLTMKKQQLMEDNKGRLFSFTLDEFMDWGENVSLEEFSNKIKTVTVDQIKEIYETLVKGMEKMRVLVVSNNKEIEELG